MPFFFDVDIQHFFFQYFPLGSGKAQVVAPGPVFSKESSLPKWEDFLPFSESFSPPPSSYSPFFSPFSNPGVICVPFLFFFFTRSLKVMGFVQYLVPPSPANLS